MTKTCEDVLSPQAFNLSKLDFIKKSQSKIKQVTHLNLKGLHSS